MANSRNLAERAVKLGGIETIALGQGRCYVVGAEEIAVFRQRDGRVFATQNRCPHRQGPLSEGVMGGGYVICPLHAHRFNLKSGAGSEPGECIHVHRVGELNGEILLSLCPPPPGPTGAGRGGVECKNEEREEQTA